MRRSMSYRSFFPMLICVATGSILPTAANTMTGALDKLLDSMSGIRNESVNPANACNCQNAPTHMDKAAQEVGAARGQAAGAEASAANAAAFTFGASASNAQQVDQAGSANSAAGAQTAGAAATCGKAAASAQEAAKKIASDLQQCHARMPQATQPQIQAKNNCQTQASQFLQGNAAENFESTLAEVNTICPNSGAGGAGQAGAGKGMGNTAKTLLGVGALAGLGALAAGLMGGDDDKPKEKEKIAEVPKPEMSGEVPASSACVIGMIEVSPGICATPGNSIDTSLTANTGAANTVETVAGGTAGAVDALGGGSGLIGSGRGDPAQAAAGAGKTANGSVPSSALAGNGASGGAGAGAGVASGRALASAVDASSAGFGAYGGFGGSSKASTDDPASITTQTTFIDGSDEKGSYIWKSMGGKRVKAYLDCRIPGRCRVRNDVRNRIDRNSLLK